MNRKSIVWIAAVLVVAAAGFFVGRWTDKPLKSSDVDADMNMVSSSAPDSERAILYWRAPMDPTEIYDEPGKSRMGMDLVPVYADEIAASAPTQEREIMYWRAPMDPTEIYDAPGKSRMGMDLVPVYGDEADLGAGGTILIDPVTAQNMGVRTGRVARMDFSRMIRTVGEVEYDDERVYVVNAKIDGWIERLFVNFVGEEVRAGTPLMEIYSPELVSTEEEYLLALKNFRMVEDSKQASIREDAAKLLASARKRLEYWDIPSSEIDRLEQTGEVQKTIVLQAPQTGIVVHQNAINGAYIKAGQDLFRIADLRTVWVHASFYENEVPWISQGQPVEMELSYLPGKTYTGRVSYVYPFLREKARDVHVRIIFSNPDLALKPGMYANVHLQGKVIRDALIVPSEAVIRSGSRTLVFVARGGGKFEPREIRIGEEGGPGNNFVRVLSGLLEGEEVVISAQFMLDSESRLQEAIQKMLAERRQPDTRSSTREPDTMPDMTPDTAAVHQH